MRTSYRRGLSALAALALVAGSLLIASPAQADVAVGTITSPALFSYQPDGAITVAGTVDASVDHAVLFDGSTPIQSLLPGPFSFSHDFGTDGDHYLTLTGYDVTNASLGDSTTQFVFGTPQMTITSPVGNGGTYHVYKGAVFDFDLTLSDPDGVTFWIASATDIATNVQTSLLGAGIGGGPYTTAHMTVDTQYLPSASYRLAAASHDSTGVPGNAASFTLIVESPVDVAFTSPTSSSVYGPSGSVAVAATITPKTTAGASWELQLDGAQVGTGIGTSVSSAVSTAGLTEGVHTLLLIGTDDNGRQGSATQTFNVDLTGPSITVLGPEDGLYINTATTPLGYGANFDAYSHVDFYVDGDLEFSEDDTDGSFGYGIDTSAWANGTPHVLRLVATDEYGNQSHVDTTVTVDTAAPNSVTFDTPSAPALTGPDLYVHGVASDAESSVATVRVDVFKFNTSTNACNAASLGFQEFTPVAGWWEGDLDLSLLPSGVYCFQATGTDEAGNVKKSAKLKPITVDTKAPAVPTAVKPVDLSSVNELSVFDWTNSSDANGPVTYDFELGDGPNLDTDATHTDYGLSLSKVSVDGSDFHPGGWYWRVRAVDALGNASAWSPNYVVTSVGVPLITAPCGCGLYGAGQDVTVTFTSSGMAVDHFVVRFTDEDGDSFSRNVAAADRQWVGPFPGWAEDGDWTIRVRSVFTGEIDGSLLGTWSDPVTVSYDGTAPLAPTLVAPDDDLVTSATDITIDWTTTDTDIAQFLLHWNKTGNSDHGVLNGTNIRPVGTGTSFDLSGLNDGEYYWQIFAMDEAGNVNFSEIRHGTIDTVAPAAVNLVSLADGSTTTSSTVTFTWQAADPAEGVAWYQFDANTTLAALNAGGTPSVQTGTSFTPPVAVANGTYFWHVRAVDAAGNYGPWSDAWSVTVAVPAPPTVPPTTPHHTSTPSTGSSDVTEPTAEPTDEPTAEPTEEPTAEPTDEPTDEPSASPSATASPEAAGDVEGFPVWIIIGIVILVLAGGGFLIRFLVLRRA